MTPVPTMTRETAGGDNPAVHTTAAHADATPARRRLHARLTTFGAAEPIRYEVDELAESGFHVMAPVASGFAVGQRYEVTIAEDESTTQLVGEGHYATVVSTETFPHGGSIGVGMRFDQPLMI